MAERINVKPQQLKMTARSFNDTGQSIKKTTGDMMSLIAGISHSIWSGEACSSYIGKFRGLQGDVTKMCKMVESQATHLDTIATEYERSESQNKEAIAALKNNII